MQYSPGPTECNLALRESSGISNRTDSRKLVADLATVDSILISHTAELYEGKILPITLLS